MRFDIMTLFPELVSSVLGESIIGRAQKKRSYRGQGAQYKRLFRGQAQKS